MFHRLKGKAFVAFGQYFLNPAEYCRSNIYYIMSYIVDIYIFCSIIYAMEVGK